MTDARSTTGTLYRDGHVYSAADPHGHRAAGTRTAGSRGSAPTPTRRPPTRPSTWTARWSRPAFVDAHVHATDTGLVLLGLDLAGTRSARRGARPARRARGRRCPADAIVVGHGWDESTLVRAAPAVGRPSWTGPAAAGWSTCPRSACTRRSCPRALLARTPDRRRPGYDAIGWLRRDAHHVVRGDRDGRDLARRSATARSGRRCAGRRRSASPRCTSAAARAPRTSTTSRTCWPSAGEPDLPDVFGYWGELGGAAKARELGAVGAGGDLYADGALGSQTAHLRAPYLDAPTGALRARVRDRRAGRRAPGRLHRAPACRAASTRSATPRSTPCSPGSRSPPATLGVDRIRAAPAPDRARRDPGQGADRRRSSSTASWPACSRRSTGCGAATTRCTPQRLGVDRSLAVEPDRRARRRRRGARVRLGLAGHAARPVGHRPGRDDAPQPGAAHRRADRVRRAHPRRLAGRAPRRPTACSRPARRRRSRSGTPRAGRANGLPALSAGPDEPAPAAADLPAHRRARYRRSSTWRSREHAHARRHDGEARPRSGAGPPGPRAGPQGRQAGRRHGPHAHHRVGRAGGAAAGRRDRRRPRRHPVGQPAGRRGARPTSGSAYGVALPVFDAMAARGHRRPDRAGAEGRGRLGPLRDARPGATRPPRARRPRRAVARRHQADRPAPGRARAAGQAARRPEAAAVDLPDRRDRRHLRGHPAGAGRGAGRRRRHRGDPLDRAVAARLRARGRDPRGLRRHLRHAGELPADAGRAGRVVEGARPLRAADQLRVRAVHAGDRHAGRARAARHDAQRLDVRHPVPRHQPDPHLRRPAVLPADPRPRRHHHQHRRGQLPHHRRRGRGGAHGHRVASCSTSTSRTRPGWPTGSSASGTRSRSTRTCRSRSGWSSRTRCWPASCSRTRR